ncbi:MAG: hypothetical protein KAW52_01960, partial [candidate division Zixibacteria bacterium]|nr:hypothetical protein [candidate division Zixibacteria bacterium]
DGSRNLQVAWFVELKCSVSQAKAHLSQLTCGYPDKAFYTSYQLPGYVTSIASVNRNGNTRRLDTKSNEDFQHNLRTSEGGLK